MLPHVVNKNGTIGLTPEGQALWAQQRREEAKIAVIERREERKVETKEDEDRRKHNNKRERERRRKKRCAELGIPYVANKKVPRPAPKRDAKKKERSRRLWNATMRRYRRRLKSKAWKARCNAAQARREEKAQKQAAKVNALEKTPRPPKPSLPIRVTEYLRGFEDGKRVAEAQRTSVQDTPTTAPRTIVTPAIHS